MEKQHTEDMRPSHHKNVRGPNKSLLLENVKRMQRSLFLSVQMLYWFYDSAHRLFFGSTTYSENSNELTAIRPTITRQSVIFFWP